MSSRRPTLLALLALALMLLACRRAKPTQLAPVLPNPSATLAGLPISSTPMAIEPTSTAALTVHLVALGENLSSIALLYRVSEEAIAQANALVPPYLVFVDQELLVPLRAATPSPASTPIPIPTPTALGPRIHIVQPGENLFRIGLRYGVTVEAIKATNGLSGDTIYVRQELIIPLP